MITWDSVKFRGNMEIPRQRPNSAAWLEISRLAETVGPTDMIRANILALKLGARFVTY